MGYATTDSPDSFVLELNGYLTLCARRLAEKGYEFNQHLIGQFHSSEMDVEDGEMSSEMPEEQALFLKVVAYTLGWLEQSLVIPDTSSEETRAKVLFLPRLYLQCLLKEKSKPPGSMAERLDALLLQGQDGTPVKRPRRYTGVVAGLETWAKVDLRAATRATGGFDLEALQNLSLKAGGRARWTALAPIKMYALLVGNPPASLFPPIGSAVSRGTERLFGFPLSESENDYSIARGLHLKLADLAQGSVLDINSGLYITGGGN